MNQKTDTVSAAFNADLMPSKSVALPVALLRSSGISPYAVCLYGLLLSYAENPVEWPCQKTLSQQMGVSERCLRTSLRQLEAAHLVTTKRSGNGQTACYQVRGGGQTR